jgi:acetyl esterase
VGPSTALQARAGATVARGLARLPHRVLRRLVGRPVVIDGQRLHVEVQLALRLLKLAGQQPLDELGVDEARREISEEARAFQGAELPISRVEDFAIAGPAGPRPARLYVPADSPQPAPALLYFHGGGFVVADLDTHDSTCRFLARHAGAAVIAVDYRRAPEHRFPAAIDDACAALRHVHEHAAELGVDPGRLAVGGDSAGGNLAAGVARHAALAGGPAPVFQLLFYPWLDLAEKRPSHALFRDGFFLTEGELDWYKAHYVRSEEDTRDPRCSPLAGPVPAGLAPAYIATAGFDPLRDEGEEYARRLGDAGVAVALRRHEGLVHGFVNAVSLGHAAREAMLEAAGALRVGLGVSGAGPHANADGDADAPAAGRG